MSKSSSLIVNLVAWLALLAGGASPQELESSATSTTCLQTLESLSEGTATPSTEDPPDPDDDDGDHPAETAPSEWLPEGTETSDAQDPVRFNGVVMLQLDDGHRGNRDPSTQLPTLDGISDRSAATSFSIRRLRLSMTARLADNLDFIAQGHFDSRDDEANFRDCYLRWTINDAMVLQAGQFKMRFGLEGFRSSSEANTIERSDATRALYQGRDFGLNLGGRSGKLQWDVGAFLGQQLEFRDEDNGQDYAVRLLYHFTDNLRMGLSAHKGSFVPDGASVSERFIRADYEFRYVSGRWTVEAEALYGDGFNFFSETNSLALGGYLATVYRLDDRWDLVLHLDALDPDLNRVDLLSPDNATNARSRVVLGANYYLARKPEHRIMLNYEFNDQWEGPRFPQNGFRVRYQYRF